MLLATQVAPVEKAGPGALEKPAPCNDPLPQLSSNGKQKRAKCLNLWTSVFPFVIVLGLIIAGYLYTKLSNN
jgi:hypothetical protein